MKYLAICCLLLHLSLTIKSQPSQHDGTEKIDSLLSKVSVEVKNVNPIKTIELATEALLLSKNIEYSKGKALSSFYIGQMLSYMGEFQKSLEYLSFAEHEQYSKRNAIIQSEISRVKGQVYYTLDLKKASFHEFQKAYSYTFMIKDEKERQHFTGLAYENLALAYKLIQNMPDSTMYWMKKNEALLDSTDENRSYRAKINLYTQFGEYYTEQQQYEKASFYFEKAYTLIMKYDYLYSSWLFLRWGDLQVKKGESDSAMLFFRKSLDNIKSTNIKNELQPLYERMAELHENSGEQDSAMWYRDQQQQVANEITHLKDGAMEEAFAILLSAEKKLSQTKSRKIIFLLTTLFLIALLVTLVFLHWFVRKKKKSESEVSDLRLMLNDTFDEVIELARSNNSAFLIRFKEVYPGFYGRFYNQHPNLTNTELRLSALIFLNFTSKEIAECMFITHRSVQTSKGRLRKKLDISSKTDLYQYIKSFS